MNTDCAFVIGATHTVCQDYALASQDSIILADGCSGSRLSDFGSRILPFVVMNRVKELRNLQELEEKECILLARPVVKMLNAPLESLDTTILCAKKYGDSISVLIYGDGVVAVKLKNSEVYIVQVEYTDSYPFFISYLLPENKERYIKWENENNKKEITFSKITANGEHVVVKEKCDLHQWFSIDGKLGNNCVSCQLTRTVIEAREEQLEFIVLFSDGITSFYQAVTDDVSKVNQSIHFVEPLKELIGFKNFNGKFVQRRMKKFKKDCAKKGWAHYDDLSMAVLYVYVGE